MQSSYCHCAFVCFVYKLRVVAFEVIVQQLHSPLLYTLSCSSVYLYVQKCQPNKTFN